MIKHLIKVCIKDNLLIKMHEKDVIFYFSFALLF